MRIDRMTRDEVKQKICNGIVILPVGAIEQHGPHLPLNTDTVIIDEVTEKVCNYFRNEFPVFKAPVIAYGNSHHHFPYPALSLTSETLIGVLKDATRSLAACGCNRIMILNSHGGNDEAIRIVARDISRECQVSIAAVSYWTVAWDRLVNECGALELGRIPGHAGGFETSLMLALRPEDVRLYLRPPQREDHIPKQENARRIYISRPNNSVGIDGYSDDARNATREFGEKLFRVIVEEVVKAVEGFMKD